MPWFSHSYRNRSASWEATRQRERDKQQASWERMKASVAAKYERNAT